MTTIFLAIAGEYSDRYAAAAFSTRDLAKTHMKNNKPILGDVWTEIVEIEFDPE